MTHPTLQTCTGLKSSPGETALDAASECLCPVSGSATGALANVGMSLECLLHLGTMDSGALGSTEDQGANMHWTFYLSQLSASVSPSVQPW